MLKRHEQELKKVAFVILLDMRILVFLANF